LLGKDLAQEGNFIVETSLDLGVQAQAESVLREFVSRDGGTYSYSQAALVTLDFRTGDILALVGGTDYSKSQFNRATQALRQPGSTFKLFGYAAALDRGISPSRSYSCAPLSWDGQNFAGCNRNVPNMDLYTGMALSENPIALRLAQDVGLDNIMRLARRMGITSELRAVPGLVLGQSEATLLEMSRAYGVVANGGVSQPTLAVTRILDAGDCQNPQKVDTCRVIYDRRQTKASEQILPASVASTLTTMLQGVVSSGTGQAASLGLGEAGKTGTTDDRRDLWFIGYVPNRSLLTGVWLGNDNNTPTSGTSGQAAALWGDYMRRIVR
jgi:penicillin-binding protein 1A